MNITMHHDGELIMFCNLDDMHESIRESQSNYGSANSRPIAMPSNFNGRQALHLVEKE